MLRFKIWSEGMKGKIQKKFLKEGNNERKIATFFIYFWFI